LHLNYLGPAIEGFAAVHPKVELDYSYGSTAQQLKALRDHRTDLAFVNLPAVIDGFGSLVVWRVPFKVVLPRRHPLAKRSSFELADLKNQDFVFCTRESRPEFYDEFLRHCANAGFRPRIVKEVGGYPTNMLGLISVGVGVGVLPHFSQVERITGLVWRPLKRPRLWVDWALVWRLQGDTRLVEAFIAQAGKHLPVPRAVEGQMEF
jgi:DNA-binding transcriptional LysR family regulator